jgi:hypothetical protein
MRMATHSDDVAPSGSELVRMFARELSDVGNVVETPCASMRVEPPAPRSRYQLGERVGQSGIAELFRGRLLGAEGFARDVAIKRALPGVAGRAAVFVDQALLASELVHPNIVQVLDFDRDADGRHFLVMEVVDGENLDALRASGPLPPSMINFIVTEILRGLGYAHDRGAVHGDLSSSNVQLSWQGAVKVSELSGDPLGARHDLFAVGKMMLELFAGLPAVPPDLEAVATKLLARGYATAGQAIAELVECRDVSRDGRGELVRLLAQRFRGVACRPVDAPSPIRYVVSTFAVAAAGWLAACAY